MTQFSQSSGCAGGRRFAVIANARAGAFRGQHIAHAIREQTGATVYQTAQGDQQRRRDISEFIAEHRPSAEKPLHLIAVGGESTLRDTVAGAIEAVIPSHYDLRHEGIDRLTDRLIQGGVHVGTIRAGGACDIGANFGAPARNAGITDIMDYLENSGHTNLSLGMATLAGQPSPVFSIHTLSAGVTLAPVYAATKEMRGLAALKFRQQMAPGIILNSLRDPNTTFATWTNNKGERIKIAVPILEIGIMATILADGKFGFPGKPVDGLAAKVFPKSGSLTDAAPFLEMLTRGGYARLTGDPSFLMPDSQLRLLAEVRQDGKPLELQFSLLPGEETEFSFMDTDLYNKPVPVQIDGDFAGNTVHARLRSLIYPLFLERDGLMRSIRARASAQNLLNGPTLP